MRNSRLLLFISTGVILLYFIIKSILFYRLEYQNDLMSCLQLSRDWLLGKPFLYENGYGSNFRVHNYFFITLLFPFTLPFGAYGLFLALFVLYLIAVYASIKALKNCSESVKYLFVLGVLMGPITFWIIDDGHFGFNCELFLFPFSLLLASALVNGNKWLICLVSLLIILVREDGILLVASIYLFYKWSASEYEKTIADLYRLFLDNFRFIMLVAIIFCVGILIQQLNLVERRSRFSYIPENIQTVGLDGTLKYVSSEFGRALGILSVPIIVIFLLGYYKILPWIFLFSLPLFAVGLLSSLYYFSWGVGLSWSVRMAYVYGFFCAATIVQMSNQKANIVFSIPKTAITIVLLLSCGGIVLKISRQYSISRLYHAIFSPSFKHSSASIQLHHQLASCLSKGMAVRAPFKYFDAYHKQDLVWPGSMQNAWQKPEVFILDKQKDEFPGDLDIYQSWQNEGLDSVDFNTIRVYFPSSYNALKSDISSILDSQGK